MENVLNLSKGQKLNLAKRTLSKRFGARMTWDENPYEGASFDLDVWAFLVKTTLNHPNNHKKGEIAVGGQRGIVFYNQLESECKGVIHSGDKTDGGVEEINVDFNVINKEVEKVVIVVSIDKADEKKQNFGIMEGSTLEIIDRENGDKIIARYELDEDYSVETAINAGEFYLKKGIWDFKIVGAGFNVGMVKFLDKYAVNAEYTD